MSTLNPEELEQANSEVYPQVPLDYLARCNQTSQIRQAKAPVRQRTMDAILRRRRPDLHTLLRLLILKRGLVSSPIECELVVADLHDLPVYDALSYVWGNREGLEMITCCGKPFAIRQNLYSGLKHVRSSDEDLVLWTDAICINQQDLQERGEQVGNMDRIYASARRVLVWLGELLPGDNKAFDTVVAVTKRLPVHTFTSAIGTRSSQISRAEVQAYEPVNALRFHHLIHFLSRPWFERVWVIQEVVKARQAVILYGDKSMPWDDFARFVQSFSDAFSYLLREYGPVESVRTVIAIETLPAINLLIHRHEEMSFFAILCMSSAFKSTDPRDKLLALFGLGDVSDDRIKPDYSCSYFEVFRKHALYELTMRHRLHYLARPPTTWQPNWPSWIPDWTEKSRSSYFYTAMDHGFQAARDVAPKLTVSSDQRTLSVTGKAIDSISSLIRPLDRKWDTSSPVGTHGSQSVELIQWLEECMRCVPLKIDLVPDYASSQLDPFLRTLACTGVYGDPYHGATGSKSHEDLKKLRRTLTQLAATKNSLSDSGADNVHLWTSLTAFASQLYPAIADRQFLKTAGNRLGWVSRRAQKEDVVCVFYGGSIPFVVRKIEDGYWRMIGECYIDGLMQGEAIQMNDVQEHTFQIR